MHELLSVVTHGTPACQYTGTRVRWYTGTTLEEHGYRRELWFRIVAREQTIVASVLLHYRGRAEAATCKDRLVVPLAPCGVDNSGSDDNAWHEEGGN